MPAQPLEHTRRLIDAALANGIISDDERRAVARALSRDGVDPYRLETALATLVGQLDIVRRDTVARRRAIDYFLDRLDGIAVGQTVAARGATGADTMSVAGGPTSESLGKLSWVGNLGRIIGPDAEYSRGVPEPAYFARSLSAHDAMVLTAEAYVAGITDHPSADLAPILAEVVTDLGASDGRPRPIRLACAGEGRRVSNNLRVHWNLVPLVAQAPAGRYHYQFRFSVGGTQWLSVPNEIRHLMIVDELKDIPAQALVESSVLFKVGEVRPARIGWLGPATVRTGRDRPAQPLPAEVTFDARDGVDGRYFLELAVQVWAPGVSNRADLTPEEHSLVLKQLGVRVESSFFIGSGNETLGFAGKAGIHEHDDIARFNLVQYLDELKTRGLPSPATGDYAFDVFGGDRKLGTLTVHWRNR